MKKYLSTGILWALLMVPFALQAQKVKKIKVDYIYADSIAPSKSVPSWVESNPTTLEMEQLTPGYYPIILRQSGDNLDYIKLLVNRMDAPVQAAQMIATEVRAASSERSAINPDEVSRALEILAQNLTEAKITGLKKNQEWWVLKKYTKNSGNYKKGDTVYDYSVMYILDKKILEKLLQDQVNQVTGVPTDATVEIKNTLDELFGMKK